MSEAPLTKILFPLPPDRGVPGETLWAKSLGDHLYQLDNTPWFAEGCALDDVVRCEETEGELPRFAEVIRPSGNRTVRVFVPEGDRREQIKEEVFEFLKRLQYIYEAFGPGKGLIAITVPAANDLVPLVDYLNERQKRGELHWEAGNF